MQLNDVKQYMSNCPDLAALDDASRAFLLWRGEEVPLKPGAVLYSEKAKLDDTFCLLLSGELVVEKGGKRVGQVPKHQLFGEMAYFTKEKKRSATVRAGSAKAAVFKIRLSQDELGAARFAGLKKNLGAQAWERFVNDSQRKV